MIDNGFRVIILVKEMPKEAKYQSCLHTSHPPVHSIVINAIDVYADEQNKQ